MINPVSLFTKCQVAFWQQTKFTEKLKLLNLTAISAMATYVSLQMLKKESFLDLVHNFSFMTLPLQSINEFTVKSSIYVIFALTFYNQNLKGRVTHWQTISMVAISTYLYCSTIKGYEIVCPPKKDS